MKELLIKRTRKVLKHLKGDGEFLINIPQPSLVVILGCSANSVFVRKNFKPTEVISLDYYRRLAADGINEIDPIKNVAETLLFIVRMRLSAKLLTVVDGIDLSDELMRSLVKTAQEMHCLPVAIALNCQDEKLEKIGFREIHHLRPAQEMSSVKICRTKMRQDLKHDHGPFDIIGDIHGCFSELTLLLQNLGYQIAKEEGGFFKVTPPIGRKAIFLGDLVDRGPNTPDVVQLVMDMVEDGAAYCVPGNHDLKLLKKLLGANVQTTHGMQDSLDQLLNKEPHFVERLINFMKNLTVHYVLDEGNLVVAHAGMKEEFQGGDSGKVKAFAIYGTTTGKLDSNGFPVREQWAEEYQGKALVVYGHTPTIDANWVNNTINIDTGCVFGGKLTAFRYPERELLSVPAACKYAESRSGWLHNSPQSQ